MSFQLRENSRMKWTMFLVETILCLPFSFTKMHQKEGQGRRKNGLLRHLTAIYMDQPAFFWEIITGYFCVYVKYK
jgi:hypothetical protein